VSLTETESIIAGIVSFLEEFLLLHPDKTEMIKIA